MRKAITTFCAVVLVFTGTLAQPDPAHAGYSCFGHDHFHSAKWIKHDKRSFVTRSDGQTWRKWYRKSYNRATGNYQYDWTYYVPCGDLA